MDLFSPGEENHYLNDEYKDLFDLLPEDLVLNVKDIVIDNKRLTLGKVIGQGQFGRVYVGTIMDTKLQAQVPVAIKTLKSEYIKHVYNV